MHIGITYDLRSEYLAAGLSEEDTAEFDRADTIDSVAAALVELGHHPDRIGHARQLINRLADGDRWDLVFNICEGLHGIGREAQVPAILDVYEIPYTFSDPLVMSLCLHKGLTKTIVADAGVPTASFAVIQDLDELDSLLTSKPNAEFERPTSNVQRPTSNGGEATVKEHFDVGRWKLDVRRSLPLFAKPVAEGTGKGIDAGSKILDEVALRRTCERLLRRYRQPVLIEQFLPGREFTVGIVRTGHDAVAAGTLEIMLLPAAEPEVYSYVNKERCEELVEYRLVKASQDKQVRRAEELALQSWRALNCRDAGRIDFRCDTAGNPLFMEANPLAGLHPSHSDLPMLFTALGKSYVELVRCIVASAAQRMSDKPAKPQPCGRVTK